jgi:hypothetical protein
MKYSNGFDLDAILPVLTDMVGWRSESKVRSFESFHALCTEQNLRDVQPTENIDDTAFTTYKANLKNDVIQQCLSRVFNEAENIEQVLLHTRVENSANQLITKQGNFCGIRFRVVPDFEKSVWIKNVTLLFDGAATFNVYLFKQGTAAPIQTKSVTTVANQYTNVVLTDWIMNYAKEQATTFYLGYFQDDLGSVKAIRETVHQNITKVFGVTYFEAKATGEQSLDQNAISYGSSPYGINAEVHSFRDYTQRIIRSASLFDEVLGLSMVAKVLELALSTTRSNDTERILKDDLAKEGMKQYLYGMSSLSGVAKDEGGGLMGEIAEKIEEVRESFNPCHKAQIVSLC